MTQTVARILNEAEKLSMSEREELTDRLVEGLVRDIAPEVQRSLTSEVRRRIAEVESGEVSLVSGEEAIQQVRSLVASARSRARISDYSDSPSKEPGLRIDY